MNKPRLIKRGAAPSPKPTRPVPAAVTLHKTVTVVRAWLGTRGENTKQSAREAFSSLFAQPQETCPEC